jgi:ubiquinone/menaquinone biosynthesis C-methylase UbiE
MPNVGRRAFVTRLGLATILGAAYAARPAAQLGGRPAADWIRTLERPERVAGLRIPEVIARLGLQSGMRVADIGAGPGVFTLPFARAVGNGQVYAVEVDQALLDHIGMRAREQGASNVSLVLGRFEDPALPVTDIDLAFFHDVLHHIADRAGYLKALARYMKPTGRVAIIERAEGREGEMHLTQAQVAAMMADAGFSRMQAETLFPDKSFVIYSR